MEPVIAVRGPYVTEIATWFKTHYLGAEGFPVWTVRRGETNGRGGAHLLTELGDYLPFLLFVGERGFVKGQLELARRVFNRNPMILSNYGQRPGPTGSWRRPLRVLPHVDSFDYSDLLLGLLRCYELDQDHVTLEHARSVWAYVEALFWRQDFVCSWHLPALRRVFPPMTEAHSGVYIELLVDLYRQTNDSRYLEQATRLTRAWTGLEYFREYSIFPYVHFLDRMYRRIPFIAGLGKRAVLFKHNTHLVAGILALYEVTHDPDLREILEKWVRGFSSIFLGRDGRTFQHVQVGTRTLQQRGILYTGFAACDLLCDMAWVTDTEDYLSLARRIADFWLGEQSVTTGLFPAAHGSRHSFVDGVTDMGVSMVKLSGLTHESRYREAASAALRGIVNFHRSPSGYVNSVDIESGEIVDSTIETRYSALLLKLFIVLEQPGNIYEYPDIVRLLRDR